MATRTTTYPGRAAFIADEGSIDRTNGNQVDWANVGAGYIDATTGKKILKAGTVIGTLLGAGKISPRVLTTNPATGILETDAVEGSKTDSLSGYGVIIGGVIYEAFLPDSTGSPRVLPAAMKTELQMAGVSTGFVFTKFEDVR
jgi:hypothetical protein